MICQLLIYIPTKIVVVRVPFTFLFFIPKLSHRLHSYSIYHNCMIWFSSFSYYRSDVAVPRLLLPRQQYGHPSEHITQGWSPLSACGGDGMWFPPLQACLRVHEWATARPWAFDELPPAEVCEELPLADKFEQPINFFRSIHLLLDWLLFCCFPF